MKTGIIWFAIALITAVTGGAQNTPQHANQLNNEGNHLAEAGESVAAEKFYQEAVSIWRTLGSEFEPHLAGSLLNLGVAFSGAGNRTEAAKVYEEALTLHRRTLGDKNHRTVSNMNLLASIYLMLGDSGRADALLQEALVTERELYPGDIQLARTLEAISNSLIRAGRFREAVAPAEEALTIVIRAAGEESLDTALAYASVGEAHRSSHNAARALPLFRKSRALYEKFLGPEHPRVACLLSQEGLILVEDGKLALAERVMVKAVNALTRSCPECIVELAVVQNNLGVLRLQQKRYREADEALTSALELREKFETQPGPQLADSLRLLAVAREKLRLHEDAVRLTNRANSILSYR
uniref:TPR repeat-containing protein n=1 Tax=Solibacter usitatus (strain Ellin6076) TaxID=234267 RepID=Q01SK0_SOLUE